MCTHTIGRVGCCQLSELGTEIEGKHLETLSFDSKLCLLNIRQLALEYLLHFSQFSWDFTKILLSDGFEIRRKKK